MFTLQQSRDMGEFSYAGTFCKPWLMGLINPCGHCLLVFSSFPCHPLHSQSLVVFVLWKADYPPTCDLFAFSAYSCVPQGKFKKSTVHLSVWFPLFFVNIENENSLRHPVCSFRCCSVSVITWMATLKHRLLHGGHIIFSRTSWKPAYWQARGHWVSLHFNL